VAVEAYMPGCGSDDAVIVKGSITHWQKPYEDEHVPAALQEEILSKLVIYFKRRDLKYRIET
jgi:hypothetical protein